MPWAIVFVYQLKNKAGGYHESFELVNAVHYITAFAIKSEDFRPEMIVFKVIAVAFLIFILLLIYKKKDRFAGEGIFLMYATIAIGILSLMFSFENTMRIRYLVPVFGIFWLSASIVIGKIKSHRILVIALILVMILTGASFSITNEDVNSRVAFNEEKADFLDSINNNNSVIVYNSDYGYRILHADLNKTKQYTLGDTYFYDDDVEVCDNLSEILDSNPDKAVYLVNWKNKAGNKQFEDNYNLTQIYNAGHYSFNLVKSI